MKWGKLKWEDGALVVGAILVVIGLGMTIRDREREKPKLEVIKKGSQEVLGESQVDSKVLIDISGQVEKPGLYEMRAGSRVGEVLVECGGLAAEADRDWVDKNINRAEKVRDGLKIYIPKKNEKVKMAAGGKVSINTALMEELDRLPGVGPALANKIIEYREENGGFQNIEELKLVPGIGEKMFEKIKEEVSL